MMREIKFRAWKEWNNKMLFFELGSVNAGDLFDSDWKVMQFTALKDKNGVEMYEGDIVTAEDGYIGLSNWQVIWRDDRWHLDNGEGGSFDNGDYYRGDEVSWETVSVVGNVHENPELLNA